MDKLLQICSGTLKEGYTSYSPSCLRSLFNGKKVSHILPYKNLSNADFETEMFLENRKRISISGVQEKLSLKLIKNKLSLTEKGEQGDYILKPIPRDLKMVDQVPANEHLTMQIASQLYDINTAQNALIFFESGEAAYLTKRFDVKNDGNKWGKEDFASLARRTSVSHGRNFKYDNISYEDVAEIIREYVGAYQVEIEKFYKLIIFNFLFSNGDAHLKNFSLLETPEGDYILSPAYDLLNTRIHVADTFFALRKGLFKDGSVISPKKNDFLRFGNVIGINENRTHKIYESFLNNSEDVHAMIEKSFLSKKAKNGYRIHFNTRLKILKGK